MAQAQPTDRSLRLHWVVSAAAAVCVLAACGSGRGAPILDNGDAGPGGGPPPADAGDAGSTGAGSSLVGEACNSTSDCATIAGGALCLTQSQAQASDLNAPGGYCTSTTCDDSAPATTCGLGTVCGTLAGLVADVCEAACGSSFDCRTGFACTAGGCVPGPPPDGGFPDAGPMNTGSPDGGPDAGLCGGSGQSCCGSGQCNGGLTCQSGVCTVQSGSGQTGRPCTHNSDCASGFCYPAGQPTGGGNGWTGNVCTEICGTNSDCVSGWTCGSITGSSSTVCKCSYGAEVCDGRDNDCDGVVDNEPAVNAWCSSHQASGDVCSNGSCTCPGGTVCSGTCVNVETDSNNCGVCGMSCVSGASCSDGNCECPGGETACSSGCTNVMIDNDNCGQCGNVCSNGIGSSCSNGGCTSGSCENSAQCPIDEVCSSSSTCVAGCDQDSDCSGSQRCNTDHTCGPAGGGGFLSVCTSDASCQAGYYCYLLVCTFGSDVTGCIRDSDCTSSTSGGGCNRTTNTCGSCSSSADCGSGSVCQQGTCFLGCVGLIECANGCSTTSCDQTCISETASQSYQLFQTLGNCLESACPSTTGGVCQTETSACDSCYSAAQMSGGACGSQYMACQNG